VKRNKLKLKVSMWVGRTAGDYSRRTAGKDQHLGWATRSEKGKATQKTAKTKATIAYAALAHKLTRAAYYTMGDGVEFDGSKLFA
jgi:hypothetical protein